METVIHWREGGTVPAGFLLQRLVRPFRTPHPRTAASPRAYNSGVGEQIVIKRKMDSPDWQQLRDAAVRAVPITLVLQIEEGLSGTFHIARGGPTFTAEGLQTKFILRRVDEALVPPS